MASRLISDLEAALPGLVKAVFSQPLDNTADNRVIVRPVLIKKRRCFQLERFRDNKAFHRNLGEEELIKAAGELDGCYRQGPDPDRKRQRPIQPAAKRQL